jgi:hypothetical protein
MSIAFDILTVDGINKPNKVIKVNSKKMLININLSKRIY